MQTKNGNKISNVKTKTAKNGFIPSNIKYQTGLIIINKTTAKHIVKTERAIIFLVNLGKDHLPLKSKYKE